MYLRHCFKYMFGNLLIGVPQYILVNLFVHSRYVSDLLGGLNIIDLSNNLKINSTLKYCIFEDLLIRIASLPVHFLRFINVFLSIR